MVDQVDIDLGNVIFNGQNEERRSWILCDQHLPRSEIVFFVQTVLVFMLVTVSIACLAMPKKLAKRPQFG